MTRSAADHSSIYEQLRVMDDDALMTPGEVAAVLRVDPKTVTRWAGAEKLGSIRTFGGHRRYRAGDIKQLVLRKAAAS